MIKQAKEGEGERWVALMNTLTEGATDGTIATFPTDATTHLQIISNLLCLWIKPLSPRNRVLLGICSTIKSVLVCAAPVISWCILKVSLSILIEYAINLNLTHYIPGHGPTGDANHAVKPYLDYLLIIQDEVEKGYKWYMFNH
jgi:hypothetical protein